MSKTGRMRELEGARLDELSPVDAALFAAALAERVGAKSLPQVSNLLRAGFVSCDLLEECLTREHAFHREVELVVQDIAAGRRAPDERQLADLLEVVGARVLVRDPSNLDLWLSAAEAVRAATEGARELRTRRSSVPATIDAAFDAGRGPASVYAIARAAAEHGIGPGAFGFGTDVTPESVAMLAEAGVRDAAALARYTDQGLTAGDAAELASLGVVPSAIAAAKATGLSRASWNEMLPGAPARWFPGALYDESDRRDPVVDGILGRGASWADVRKFVDGGWADMDLRLLDGNTWASDDVAHLRLEHVHAFIEIGVTFAEMQRWARELCLGKASRYGEANSQTLPPLVFGRLRGETAVRHISALVHAGVKPSWLGEFRNCGARSVDDVLAIRAAGIDASRARELRSTLPKPERWSKQRFARASALIAAHRADLAKADSAHTG